MKEMKRFLSGVFLRDPEATQARERYQVALREAKGFIKKLERELKDRGSNGVLVHEDELVLFSGAYANENKIGREIDLCFDLSPCLRSDVNPTGWESREVRIGVIENTGVTIVGFSTKGDSGFGGTLWLEESIGYIRMANLRAQAAEEGLTSNPEFTLEEQLRFAMRNAQYVTDARYDRSLD